MVLALLHPEWDHHTDVVNEEKLKAVSSSMILRGNAKFDKILFHGS